MTTHYRQGDVLMIRVLDETIAIKKGAEVEREDGRIVLAHGEATGHAHAIAEKSARMFVSDEGHLLELDADAQVVHEEHDTISLPKGTYRVIRQREYTPEEVRNVAD